MKTENFISKKGQRNRHGSVKTPSKHRYGPFFGRQMIQNRGAARRGGKVTKLFG